MIPGFSTTLGTLGERFILQVVFTIHPIECSLADGAVLPVVHIPSSVTSIEAGAAALVELVNLLLDRGMYGYDDELLGSG